MYTPFVKALVLAIVIAGALGTPLAHAQAFDSYNWNDTTYTGSEWNIPAEVEMPQDFWAGGTYMFAEPNTFDMYPFAADDYTFPEFNSVEAFNPENDFLGGWANQPAEYNYIDSGVQFGGLPFYYYAE